jgi:hypothetical protein
VSYWLKLAQEIAPKASALGRVILVDNGGPFGLVSCYLDEASRKVYLYPTADARARILARWNKMGDYPGQKDGACCAGDACRCDHRTFELQAPKQPCSIIPVALPSHCAA